MQNLWDRALPGKAMRKIRISIRTQTQKKLEKRLQQAENSGDLRTTKQTISYNQLI